MGRRGSWQALGRGSSCQALLAREAQAGRQHPGGSSLRQPSLTDVGMAHDPRDILAL